MKVGDMVQPVRDTVTRGRTFHACCDPIPVLDSRVHPNRGYQLLIEGADQWTAASMWKRAKKEWFC